MLSARTGELLQTTVLRLIDGTKDIVFVYLVVDVFFPLVTNLVEYFKYMPIKGMTPRARTSTDIGGPASKRSL